MAQPEPFVQPVDEADVLDRNEQNEVHDELGLASRYCPRCSAHLEARSCKLICPSCGYYMSCSDFY
jgi:exosome complex RNA-binding protein Csl4